MGFFKAIKDAWEEAGGRAGKVIPLDDRIANAAPTSWTKEQFNDWLDTLEDPIREQILLNCKAIMAQGKDYMVYLHQIRRKVDADAKRSKGIKKIAANAKGTPKEKSGGILGGMNIFDIVWAWDEAMLMSDQREFFARENREARNRK